MVEYFGRTDYVHGSPARIGVLLANLGTPDAPTAKALYPYLRDFLFDPRIIELPKWKWWLIMNAFILRTRPKKSAELYSRVWTDRGSPLLFHSQDLRDGLAKEIQARYGDQILVELGMRYGNPTMESAMKRLLAGGADRVLVVPLFPQYSATTTGSTVDDLGRILSETRWVPHLRVVSEYATNPLYITALVNSIREFWDRDGKPDKLLFSYHGIPKRYYTSGDPYPCHCLRTSRLVTEQLGLSPEQHITTFQSVFGREEWVKPATIDTIAELPKKGVERLDVICPGFSADCLETIEEIDEENRHAFLNGGGKQFRYIPALNSRPDHVQAILSVVEQNIQGWVTGAVQSIVSARSVETAGCPHRTSSLV